MFEQNEEYGLPGECQLTIRLLEMLQRTQYELVQENGQRRLTAPEIIRGEKQRMKGAEVFMGRLPRDCYEDELMPVLEKIGRLMELRLMLDFSGSTRGYAFALFENSKIARRACAELDGYEIRPGHRIGVVKSVDNCRLFFGGVPKNKCREEFMEELQKLLEGIIDIYLYPSAHDKALNRGFIFVEFKDHRAAAMARRKLIPGKVMLWDHEIAVDWADPEPGDPVDEEIMETVTALFVRNLSLDMSQQRIREIFQKTTKIPVLKLKKINHFAFVHYESRQAAQNVMDIMTRPHGVAEMEGWEIRWAKPIGAAKVMDRQRCINEAVASSNVEKCDQTRDKQSLARKYKSKRGEDLREKDPANLTYIRALENMIKERLNAHCYLECLRVIDTAGFICKISIFREEKFLFEYHGEVMPSKQKAITAACVKLYHHLTSSLGDHVLQAAEQYYSQEKANINPVVGSAVDWKAAVSYN
ncbi:hypothetical protein KM043_005528 [Ampulex compressa]|nr:hypothetical protein KM043_005528 [Ampulex compressa]